MFPCFTERWSEEKKKKSPSQNNQDKRRGKQIYNSHLSTRHGQSVCCPSIFEAIAKWLYTNFGLLDWQCHKSLCVTCFSFPFNDVSFDVFFSSSPCVLGFNTQGLVAICLFFGFFVFFFVKNFEVIWRFTPIFVWSIQSHSHSLGKQEKKFSCMTFLCASGKGKKKERFVYTGRRSMQIVPNTRKREREREQKSHKIGERENEEMLSCGASFSCSFFCCLIMEQNAEIPFAKAILQYNDNVPSFPFHQCVL